MIQKNKLNVGFLLQNKKVALFWPGDARRRSVGVSSSCCDSQVERSEAASKLDRFSRFFKLAISFNECFNFNERLPDLSSFIHFTCDTTTTTLFTPSLPPAVTWSLFGDCWLTVRWPSTQLNLICSTQPSPSATTLSFLINFFYFIFSLWHVSPSYVSEALISLQSEASEP